MNNGSVFTRFCSNAITMFITGDVWFYSLLLGSVIIFLFYKFITARNNYWKDRLIVYAPPKFLVGNLQDVITNKRTQGEIYKEYYDKYVDQKYVGLFRFTKPVLLVRDPNILRDVFIKNFNYFQNRLEDHNELKEKLLTNMFTAKKERWRTTRQKLSPTFSSGKLKNMFYLIVETAGEFERILNIMVERNEEVEVRELMARLTTDVIGSCAFGLRMNSMLDDENTFRMMGKQIFRIDWIQITKQIFRLLSPSLFYLLGLKMFSNKLENFFIKIVKDVIESRKDEKVKRNDFIDLLIELKHQNGKVDFEMDDEYMAAQAFIFFAAGFETSSTAMSSVLYELAINPVIQDKLVKEIETVLNKTDGKITYESIMEMEYLDMVMNEGLRKYPALHFIPRTCTMTHKLNDDDLIIEKGINIIIPVLGLHYDPKYYPDPEKFIPERFLPENKNNHSMVYLPFGEGPRNCIGMRFGKIQSKVGILSLLRKYKVEPSPRTKKPVFEPRAFVSSPKGGIYLKLTKRTDNVNNCL